MLPMQVLLLLRIALFAALPPSFEKEPATLEEACDPAKLAPLMSVQKPDVPPLIGILDRRIQKTLYEERQVAAQNVERAKQVDTIGPRPA